MFLLTKKLLNLIETGEVEKFYKSKEWKKVAKYIRKIQNNECQECKKRGEVGKADVVHHKKHLRQYPLLALDPLNLECLCHKHHELKHPEKFGRYRKENNIKSVIPEDYKERW